MVGILLEPRHPAKTQNVTTRPAMGGPVLDLLHEDTLGMVMFFGTFASAVTHEKDTEPAIGRGHMGSFLPQRLVASPVCFWLFAETRVPFPQEGLFRATGR